MTSIRNPDESMTPDERAEQMCRVRPAGLLDQLGMTRQQFYAAHIKAAIAQAHATPLVAKDSGDLTVVAQDIAPISRDVVKAIALDIGKEVASHIEVMYPNAVAATSKTMLRSLRNCVYNEIIAALNETDEEAIMRRLEERKRFRRQHRARYSALRDQPITDDIVHDL